MKIMTCVAFSIVGWLILLSAASSLNGQAVDALQARGESRSTPAGIKPDDDKVALVARPVDPSFASTQDKTGKSPTSGPEFSWSRFYIGANFGYSSGKTGTRFEPLPSAAQFIDMLPVTIASTNKGYTVGGQAGYNWQSGHFVAGPEFTLAWSSVKGTKTVTPIIRNNGAAFPGGLQTTTQELDYLGSLRARAGGAWSRVFIYGTGGVAFGKINHSALTDYRPVGTTQYLASASETQAGWTAGIGTEIAVSKHWSLKGEYLYYDLGGGQSRTVDPTPSLPPFQVRYTWQSVTLHSFNTGINFRW